MGVSEGGGVGGGNGCSSGAPYGRCTLTAGWSGGAVGVDEDTGGITIAAEEGGGTKKEEGFTSFVTRLLLLRDSGASCWGIRGVDVERAGICKLGTTGVTAWVGTEDEEIVAEDW